MTYRQLLEHASQLLKDSGIEEADTDAWLLFSAAMNVSRSTYFLKQNETAGDEGARVLEEWLKRRGQREPVQYILGDQEFMGLTFKVSPEVLIPRLDTEVLVEHILDEGVSGKRVLDLCTGSGCIITALAVLGKPAYCVGTDISEGALDVATLNAADNGAEVTFLQGDLYCALSSLPADKRHFDIIVSNPPYISEEEKESLAPEVIEHEPHLALFADDGGMAVYKRILGEARSFLAPGGVIWFEIGCTQGERICFLAREHGMESRVYKDLAGLDRVVRLVLEYIN